MTFDRPFFGFPPLLIHHIRSYTTYHMAVSSKSNLSLSHAVTVKMIITFLNIYCELLKAEISIFLLMLKLIKAV